MSMETPAEAPRPPADLVADDEERRRQIAKPPPPADPVRRWTLIVLGVCAALIVYNLVADRITPYTNQATVQAFVVDVAPEVAGRIVSVDVEDNKPVRAGQTLFRLDRTKFLIAVQEAEAALAQAGQSIGASTSQIAAAQAQLSAAETALAHTREQAARVLELVSKGVYAKARGDRAEAEIKTATEGANQARSNLEAARRQLGPQGADNPQIRAATAQLERAQLDLQRCDVTAPADGVVTNLKLAVGQFVAAGSPAMTFIDAGDIWVTADMREKSLGNVQPGDRAAVVLDAAPGRVFAARVRSIGWGVSQGNPGAAGLPTVSEEKGWVRPPQRFRVLLTIEEPLPRGVVRLGSRASVTVYSGATNPVLNVLASIGAWLVAWMAYVV